MSKRASNRNLARDVIQSLIVDPEYYDTLENYKPGDGYHRVARDILPDAWRIAAKGVWRNCQPVHTHYPLQGWKIHVSSSLQDAKAILRAAIPVLVRHNTAFKFATDPFIFELMNSKGWPRGGSGKFMTIYPSSAEQFRTLLNDLYIALKTFRGPYVLSDKRYRDCQVLYYRYGGIKAITQLRSDGRHLPQLVGPDAHVTPDHRHPRFHLPDWVEDPFPDEPIDEQGTGLLNDRYSIKGTLGFSNTGGVYLADDVETGQEVVIKEARPFTQTTRSGDDALTLLAKEYRLLTTLSKSNVTARPIDYFQDWEHYFLVQEKIDGISISKWNPRNAIALQVNPTEQEITTWFEIICRIALNLSVALDKLHKQSIVFGDLSPNNILLDETTFEVKLIDFEGACQEGIDRAISLFTPGFVSPTRERGPVGLQDDLFGLGAILFSLLFPLNSGLLQKPSLGESLLDNFRKDFGVPDEFCTLISNLMDKNANARPKLEKVIVRLRKLLDSKPVLLQESKVSRRSVTDLLAMRDGLVQHALSVARYEREDRIFPCDFNYTDSLSIDHGALGVAYGVHTITGTLPKSLNAWLLNQSMQGVRRAPGLYNGLAGISWVFDVLGFEEKASDAIRSAYQHPLLYESTGLYSGAAGVGLALCHHFHKTSEETYLAQANAIASVLIKLKQENDAGIFWQNDVDVDLGYAHGGAGISLFLLRLYQLTGDSSYLSYGEQALRHDMSHVTKHDSGVWSFAEFADKPGRVMPYWLTGSAGVGTSLIRYYQVTGKEEYRSFTDCLLPDIKRKYTVSPGLFNGVVGLGNFLLDHYQAFNETASLDACNRVVEGLDLFLIKEETGYSVPGQYLHRKSMDFSTGSIGVALFLDRLIEQTQNFNLTLDRVKSNYHGGALTTEVGVLR